MPPFKAGLVKRKINDAKSAEAEKVSDDPKQEESEEEGEDLFTGQLELADDEDDATDSECEQAEAASDAEQDEVLYDSADSVFSADESGDELSGSSEGEETDESGETEQDENDTSSEDTDSGAESGNGPSAAGSSDESIKRTQGKLSKNQKPKAPKKAPGDIEKPPSSVDMLADRIKEASVHTEPVQHKDEYESGDTSDEEDRVNTVGEVPMWWYNEYSHVGYDLDGRRIARPPQRDQIDEFLKKCEDPEFWRTVKDPTTGQDVILSKEDLQLIERIRGGRVPNAQHEEYEPWVEWFSREVLATPLRAFPEHKRSFLPSHAERQRVARLVHALKMGWARTRKQIADQRRASKERRFYNLWGAAEQPAGEEGAEAARRGTPLPAPRRPPPAHAESYNPPPEYLLDRREMKEWDKLSETPWKRKYTFLPTKYGSLRAVPAYERFVRERFLRCLDLYLAPRALKMRLTITPEQLVPALPAPRDLQPFPTAQALVFAGHADVVRSVDFDPSGQYIVSGSDDGTLKLWETSTARCVRTVPLGAGAAAVAWSPARGLPLLAAAAGARLLLLAADVGSLRLAARARTLLDDAPPAPAGDHPPDRDAQAEARVAACARWAAPSAEERERGVLLTITHFNPLVHMSWHAKGDYVAVTVREGGARAVLVHQLSRRRSHLPFRRAKGLVQCALFHTHKPLLFVATQRAVRVYDLVRQQLVRTLRAGAQWISSLALHPAGDNLLVGSYDRKCVWFDLELSSSPYRTLRLHAAAVRAVAFHRRYPLFASAGDDGRVLVCHGMVYNDLLQNPLLVPLKQLRGPDARDGLSALDVRFHPAQPWLLVAGADGTLRLYS